MLKRIIRLLPVITITLFSACAKHIETSSLFSSGMVLQQNSDVPIWGKGSPGEQVLVKGSWGAEASAVVKDDSSWMCRIHTAKAGGPYEVIIQMNGSELVYTDVLLGEVWLLAGQSNMEMKLKGRNAKDTVTNSGKEIEAATYPNIRFFTVQRKLSAKPLDDCTGIWQKCAPESAANFSAVGYFFGKKLHTDLNVPVGLILSSWGGSPIQAWTEAKVLESVPGYENLRSDVMNIAASVKRYDEWLAKHKQINLKDKPDDTKWMDIELNDSLYASPGYNDSAWETMNLPCYIEDEGLPDFNGFVWFRKKITLPDNWLNKDLSLEPGRIDDMERVYFNGKLIGATEQNGGWMNEWKYSVPADLNNMKEAVIAIRLLDPVSNGGFTSKAEKMKLRLAGSGNTIPINGEWKYLPAAELKDDIVYVFAEPEEDVKARPEKKYDFSNKSPSLIYNGMLHPLIPYAVKGAAWYQGETNIGEPDKYAELFPLLINSWRNAWGYEFPFYYVQIAPYLYGENLSAARLREAQSKALALPNTGMAVTLDLGKALNIHPPEKKKAGERLALIALANSYGKNIEYSGPVYKSMKVEGNKIILEFDHASGLAVIPDSGRAYFTIAGSDKQFKEAKVKVDEGKLTVSSPDVKKPAAVRYAWENATGASLYNSAGLPASSFRTDNWEE